MGTEKKKPSKVRVKLKEDKRLIVYVEKGLKPEKKEKKDV